MKYSLPAQTPREYCEEAIKNLASAYTEFGAMFVDYRMEFHGRFQKGLICSIIHGPDFFQNVLDCLGGKHWKEEGEYGNNFRQFIKMYEQTPV